MNIFVTVPGNQNSWIGFNKMDVGVDFWVVGFHNVRRCSTAAVRDQFPSTSFPHVFHLWCGRDFMNYSGLKQNKRQFLQVMQFSCLLLPPLRGERLLWHLWAQFFAWMFGCGMCMQLLTSNKIEAKNSSRAKTLSSWEPITIENGMTSF